MMNNILITLDGSALVECILPYILAISRAFNTRFTLLHVLERPHTTGSEQAIDPLEWHLKKQEAEEYLQGIATQLRGKTLKVKKVILEACPRNISLTFPMTGMSI